MQRATLLQELRQDAAYAARMLRRNPGFTVIAVATLALGIGANTSIYSLIEAILLRRLNVPQPEQLVVIGDATRVGGVSIGSPRLDMISYNAYDELRDNQQSFTDVLASGRAGYLFTTIDSAQAEPDRPLGRFVSANYFGVLQVPMFAGRGFGPAEAADVGASPVAVISHEYWTRRFGSRPSAIGSRVTINGSSVTIVGIAREGFTGEIVGQHTDLWLPLTMQPVLVRNMDMLRDPRVSWLLLMGRRKPGVSLEQARAEMERLVLSSIRAVSPDAEFSRFVENLSAGDVIVSDGSRGLSRVRQTYFVPLLTLMAGVGLLLLIVCANVANLLLARAAARAREMSLRVALGARRSRLVRQLLTESAALSLLGAAAGLLLGWWGSRLLLTLAADGGGVMPVETAPSGTVAAFTVGVSLFAVFLFGMVPALSLSRVDLAGAMRAQSRSLTGGGSGGRLAPTRLVIMAQVALSLVLLVSAGLLVRSLWSLQHADIGMDRDHLLIVDVDARGAGYTGARFPALTDQLTSRIERLPGVAAVSFSENGIFSGTESASTVDFEGFTARTQEDSVIYWDEVGPGYAHTTGARLLAGRDFTPEDRGPGADVLLLNQSAAAFYFPDGNAVGRWMKMDSLTYRIVGVITDAQDHDLRAKPVRRMYLPYLNPVEYGPLRFIVRTTGNPAAAAAAVRKEIVAQDPLLPIFSVQPLPNMLRNSIRAERLVARLATGFGVLALVLAAIGLYGVMSYAISQRTGEIGLRFALGAQRGDVIGMILGDALKVVGFGAVAGVLLSFAAVRLLSGQLYGVEGADPLSIGAAVGVLLVSGCFAALMPALRGARVTPLEALRE